MSPKENPQLEDSDLIAPKQSARSNHTKGMGPPAANEIWSYLQRCLSSEEPLVRWQKLRQRVARQLHQPLNAFNRLSITAQDQLITQLYGSTTQSPAAVMFNLILAWADTQRYKTQAFDEWLAQFRHSGVDAGLSSAYLNLAQELGLQRGQSVWVARSGQVVPDWTVLAKPGPWRGDCRTDFVLAALQALSFASFPLTVDELKAGKAKFFELLQAQRGTLPGSFFPQLILLVEGVTEALVLPSLFLSSGLDVNSAAVNVISAGGADQVLRKYLHLRDRVSWPMMVVLDGDARLQALRMQGNLRDEDRMHMLSQGEVEDIFDLPVFVRLVNEQLEAGKLVAPINEADFPDNERRTDVLNRLWRKRRLGDFDKIGLAKTIVERGLAPHEIPSDVEKIGQIIREQLTQRERERS